tara:strand:+ start:89 stop:619 length:531 start_codon:yes stop_codon:yes gene_type:complete
MNNTKTLKKFNKTLEFWNNELNKYDIDTLLEKPNSESWSMGQVYIHLINSTLNFHLQQVKTCLENKEHSEKKKNFKGIMTYNILGSFPPIKINVPPTEFYTPKQPENKEEIIKGLSKVKTEMELTLPTLETEKQGKTNHPGFSYLNGNEWYQLIEMHFRHHLRQKTRIDQFLKDKK